MWGLDRLYPGSRLSASSAPSADTNTVFGMKRPLHIWSVFIAVLLLAVALFAWLSAAVLRLDDAQRRYLAEAEREEKVRLALWRMDSVLAVLVATEDARSPLEYQAFHSPRRAWAPDNKSIPTGRFLLPSPLMTAASTNTRLHFEFGPERIPVSPRCRRRCSGSWPWTKGFPWKSCSRRQTVSPWLRKGSGSTRPQARNRPGRKPCPAPRKRA